MVWNELMARWRTYAEAMGGPAPSAVPPPSAAFAPEVAKPHKIDPPVTQTWDPFADTGAHAAPESNAGNQYAASDTTGYTPPQKTEYYCAVCFRRKHVSEMKSTPNGMACLSCGDSSQYGIRSEGISAADASTYKVEFTGTGAEYFKIWIVNLLLTVLTLGIYSAWAKVRKNRYFYRNTRLAGSSFNYHGNPVAILRGRILAVVLLVALTFSQRIDMTVYAIVLILIAIMLPWMITRACAFRLYNTSWRGIRLRFHGTLTNAYISIFLFGLLTICSGGLCFPLLYRELRLFLGNNASFGTTRSSISVSAGAVYGVFLRTFLMSFVVFIVLAVVYYFLMKFMGSMIYTPGREMSQAMFFWIFVIAYMFYLFYQVILKSFFRTRMTNLMWEHTKLGTAYFQSFQRARDLASIIATNAILTFLTLGFYWPWAKIQLTKYYVDTVLISAPDGLSNFTADAETTVTAAGDEITGALDVDFSF